MVGLEHATVNEFDAAVVRLRDGDRLDARATTIGTERLHALLEPLKDGSVVSVATFVGRPSAATADLDGATFSGDAGFAHASFERARQIGALLVGERLRLDACVFADELQPGRS
ncbi:MAG: hypothetical protein QOI48_1121 [Solirubrobacteraceae bacterium]|nr:hypothetical protein [Solirubrobacteraceae bacterium]